MDLKRMLVCAATAIGLAAMAGLPAADAFHGAFWLARGTAMPLAGVPGAPVGPVNAVLTWSGQQVQGIGTMTVELRAPGTNTLLHKNVFQAQEDVSHVFFVGCIEMVEPYSNVGLAGGPQFRIGGVMRNSGCDGTATNDFSGPYLSVFHLDVHVRGFDHG